MSRPIYMVVIFGVVYILGASNCVAMGEYSMHELRLIPFIYLISCTFSARQNQPTIISIMTFQISKVQYNSVYNIYRPRRSARAINSINNIYY